MVNALLIALMLVIPRQEVIDSAFSNANVEWVCDSINAAPVPYCPDWHSDYQVGHTYHGVAYEFGGWDDPTRFLAKLAQGQRAGSHSDNDCISYGGDPSWATGQDCSGLITIVWQLPHKYSTAMLPDITHPISYDSLKMGDAINRPHHHVVLFYQWADSSHTRLYIFQATDRRPNPSTTGLDLRYTSYYRYNYTPIRYPLLVDSLPQDTLPNDTLPHDTIPQTLHTAQGVFRRTISFIKPAGITDYYLKIVSTNGALAYKEHYGAPSREIIERVSPDIPTGVYMMVIESKKGIVERKKFIFLR